MIDIVSKQKRSEMMSNIGPTDTEAELMVRRYLHALGFRYKLHQAMGPAAPSKRKFKPDIYLPKYNAVILVNGCYWHQHEGCKFATTPDDPTEAWQNKFQLNPNENRYGNGSATIVDVGIYSMDGQPSQALKQMAEYEFRVCILFHEQIKDPIASYRIKNIQGLDITGTNTLYNNVETGVFEAGHKLFVSFTQKICLSGGGYLLSCGCAGFEQGEYVVYERRYDVLAFEVAARNPCIGDADLDSKITITKNGYVST